MLINFAKSEPNQIKDCYSYQFNFIIQFNFNHFLKCHDGMILVPVNFSARLVTR